MHGQRQIFLSDIQLSSSRINFSKTAIVLLCGGYVPPPKNNADDPDPPISSLRHAVTVHALNKKVPLYQFFRPEEITSWQADSVFKNLMDFETDLAGICSLVVIIVESEGAIAELGAFSQIPSLKQKIVVFNPLEYQDSNSFINLGILRHVRDPHESSVKSYPWRVRDIRLVTDQILDDIIDDIQDEIELLPKSQTFKSDNGAHIFILIYELIRLFVALKESEIHESLMLLGVSIEKDALKSKLFLMGEFGLVKREIYSDAAFYISKNEDFHKIRLSFKSEITIDPFRVRRDFMEHYKSTTDVKDKKRSRAIHQAFPGASR